MSTLFLRSWPGFRPFYFRFFPLAPGAPSLPSPPPSLRFARCRRGSYPPQNQRRANAQGPGFIGSLPWPARPGFAMPRLKWQARQFRRACLLNGVYRRKIHALNFDCLRFIRSRSWPARPGFAMPCLKMTGSRNRSVLLFLGIRCAKIL